ncbi:SusC/RagA family TonB-linked outer membrane protein [Niabella sp.]|uniref:SusC/RagA family TonB-linked outer membrane protein n=1 Tax=Niabella sp. TaxID=1962976 RepID=UPI00261DB0A0|nr:SusC/RagA family TonB-linked outer membrane protein [Niabella sp.]
MQQICSKCSLLILLFLFALPGLAQVRTVTGLVRDETTGTALAGATIAIKGKTTTVVANDEGAFSITAGTGDVLLVSYTGYDSKQVTLGGQTTISITLSAQNSSKMDEVIVVGYGTQKRRDFNGAASKVNPLALEHNPSTNVATALQGTVPGLLVQQTTGQPGSSPRIVFRGGTGFDGTGDPLVVVDGVVLPSLYGLDMNDIESMDVLKDAASTAIYGARAANGVVLITTKKGKKGRTQAQYSIRQTINDPRSIAGDYLSAADYIRMNRQGLRARYIADSLTGTGVTGDKGQLTGAWGWALGAANTSPVGLYTTQLVTNANRKYLTDPNWKLLVDRNPFSPAVMDSILYREIATQEREAMLMQRTNTTEHSLGFSGGNDQGAFALNLNAVKDNGVIIGSWLKRINMNFNGSLNIGKNLKVALNTSAYNIDQGVPYSEPGVAGSTGATGGLMQRFLGVAPTVRYYNDTSGVILPGPNDVSLGNPQYWGNLYINSTNQQRFMGSLNIEYTLLPFLKFVANGSGYMLYQNNNYFTKAYQQGNGGSLNTTRSASFSNYRDIQYTYNAFLQFDKNINNHNISFMAGGEFSDYKRYTFSGSASGAPTDIIPWLTAATPPAVVNGVIVNPSVASSNFPSWERLASAIGKLNYAYRGKYFFTGILRLDGSSRLDPVNYYGLFPGASAGWNLHNEDFYKNSKLSKYISTVKPRISYGENGNLQYFGTNYFPTAQVYANAGVYNGLGGTYAPSYINPDLRWERTNSLNFGADLGFFRDRITVIGDYFIRNVFDKLASLPISAQTGFTSYTTNLSQLQNRGWEFSLNAKVIVPEKESGFSLDVGATYSTVKSYAVKLPYNGLPGNRQGTIQVWDPANPGQLMQVNGLIEGQRVGYDEVWAPKWSGIYTTQDMLTADASVYNAFLPYTGDNKKFKQLGDARWYQVNKNDTIDSRQYVFVGRTTPKASGSFFLNAGFKGFRLYTAFDYAYGFVILNNNKLRGLSQVQGSQNSTKEVLDTWTPDHPDASLPMFYWANQGRNFATDASGNNPPANLWEKGDYLMLREMTLSYSLTRELLATLLKNKIKGLNLSVTGSNLVYLTKYSGIFPEVGGFDNGRYPLPRRLTFGAQITF